MIKYKKFNLNDYADCVIVTDDNLSDLYGIKGDNVYILPQGERAKNFFHVESLCKWLVSCNFPRNGRIVAVGGGSLSDTVGFAASVYKRGVSLTIAPTTFLAQIDASIGGKTSIDVGTVKNAVGSFYAADVVIDVDFLKTLDERQMLNGYGELLKYRMLCPVIDNVSDGNISDIIKACVDYKMQLCNADLYDLNVRRKLNFGHTIGHAMELSLGLPHGIAVANGLYYETSIARKLNKCNKQYFDKWMKEIQSRFKIYSLTSEALDLTLNDKKNMGGDVAFVLPDKFDVVSLPLEYVKTLL